MYSNANGEVGGPVRLDSLLLDLDAKLRFEAWVSIHQLGMLADHEITYDTGAGRFRLAAPKEGSEGEGTELQ
jgi:hypothetical protein